MTKDAARVVLGWFDNPGEPHVPEGQLGIEHLEQMSATQIVDAVLAGQFQKLLGQKGIR